MLFFDTFDYWGRTRPAQIFCEDETGALTYGAAYSLSNRMAGAMRSLELSKGDPIALLSKNTTTMLLMYLAAARAGLVPVPLNYRLAAAEWLYILQDSGARMIYAEAEYCARLDGVLDQAPRVHTRIMHGAQPERGAVDMSRWRAFDDWIAEMPPADQGARPEDGDQLYQMYTSGTTGHPKGVVISHRSFYINLSQFISVLSRRPAVGDTGLVISPLYHAAAVYMASLMIQLGMTIILHREFDPVRVVEDMARKKVAFTFLVPAMIQQCLVTVKDIDRRDWSGLKGIMYGASPIAISVLRHAMTVFDCDFYQAYGLTETTAILSILDPEDHKMALSGRDELLLSAGRALPGSAVKICDARGARLPPGEIGEICGAGDQIMDGYWKRPEATMAALREDWLHTGDAGIMDAAGYVYIQDRIKDMVVSGGENIYPREVENVLFSHPAIIDAAVIGVPDEKYGEALLAFVVAGDGQAPGKEDIIAFCRESLGGYKVPRRIEFCTTLPRNASGKLLKKELREPYWAHVSRKIG